MSEFGDTTGMINPIFNIMKNSINQQGQSNEHQEINQNNQNSNMNQQQNHQTGMMGNIQ